MLSHQGNFGGEHLKPASTHSDTDLVLKTQCTVLWRNFVWQHVVQKTVCHVWPRWLSLLHVSSALFGKYIDNSDIIIALYFINLDLNCWENVFVSCRYPKMCVLRITFSNDIVRNSGRTDLPRASHGCLIPWTRHILSLAQISSHMTVVRVLPFLHSWWSSLDSSPLPFAWLSVWPVSM
jgi:hypothetical protein